MSRLPRTLLALTLALSLPIALIGCGGGEETGEIEDTPAAVKADEAGQDAMLKFMQSQGKAQTPSTAP